MPQISVLCVDDHALMREGIVRILGLESDISVVAQAGTAVEAIEAFLKYRPDVTLMDLRMPGMSGVDGVRAIRHADIDARIIVLTMYQGDEDIYRALEAGANGYLLKDALPQQLINGIREVYAGRPLIPDEILTRLQARMSQAGLTARELQIIELVAQGKRNKEIAQELNISPDTARAYLRSIFVKLNVHDRTAALSEALRRGLVHLG